jgi:prepilin-type N-terminal cleavage/methylation domain-containing protein
MARTRLQDLARRRLSSGPEPGFTLIELIIGVAISLVLIGALGEALFVSLLNDKNQTSSLSDSQHAGISANYLETDVQSASPSLNVSGQTATNAINETSNACDGASGGLLNLKWTDTQSGSSVQHSVSYVLRGSKLERVTCLPATSAGYLMLSDTALPATTVTCSPSCGSPQTITLNVKQITFATDRTLASQGSTPVSYSLTGQVQTSGQAVGGTIGAPPLLLLGAGGACSTQTGVLKESGHGTITLANPQLGLGSPYVNSCSSTGISMQDAALNSPTPLLMPTGGGCTSKFCPTIQNTTTTYPDPFAAVPDPSGSACTGGTHTSSWAPPSNLAPGVYCITGSGSTLTLGNITESGVMFYVSPSSTLAVTGNAQVSPPTSGPYDGLATFWRAPSGTSLTIKGAGWTGPSGVFYAPGVNLTVGNSSGSSLTAGIAILGSLTVKNGTVTVG